MNDMRPISAAPKDGTQILVQLGDSKFFAVMWYDRIRPRWCQDKALFLNGWTDGHGVTDERFLGSWWALKELIPEALSCK